MVNVSLVTVTHNPHSSELSDFSSYRNTYVRARTLSHV